MALARRVAQHGKSAASDEAVAKAIVESGLLPAGTFQLICGSVGDLFDHLGVNTFEQAIVAELIDGSRPLRCLHFKNLN